MPHTIATSSTCVLPRESVGGVEGHSRSVAPSARRTCFLLNNIWRQCYFHSQRDVHSLPESYVYKRGSGPLEAVSFTNRVETGSYWTQRTITSWIMAELGKTTCRRGDKSHRGLAFVSRSHCLTCTLFGRNVRGYLVMMLISFPSSC